MAEKPDKIRIDVIGKLGKEELEKNNNYIETFYAQYNPAEYTVTKGAQIAEIGIPGLDSPILQFVRGTNEQISLKLFFDTTDDGNDVREKSEKFYNLVKINSDLHAPPVCRLSWGSPMGGLVGKSVGFEGVQENKFRGIVTNITQRFTLFKRDGTPLRSEMDVTFKEYKTLEQQLRELKLNSPDHTKIRRVQQGDTLSSIAESEYDDPGQWREIAKENNISNPRAITPGQVLNIPPLD